MLSEVDFHDEHAQIMSLWRYEGKAMRYQLPSFASAQASQKSYTQPTLQKQYRALLLKDEMVAFYRLQPQQAFALFTFGVAPSWMGKGIGKEVIKKGLQRAKCLGYLVVRSKVRVWNTKAIHLLQSFGFQIQTIIPEPQWGDIAVLEWNNDELQQFYERIKYSKFRSSFHLKTKEKRYVQEKGYEEIMNHAFHFVQTRLQMSQPQNDGAQTPMKGHPIFIAQHACGCCCRGCLSKWHQIMKGHELSESEVCYIVSVLMGWIRKEMK